MRTHRGWTLTGVTVLAVLLPLFVLTQERNVRSTEATRIAEVLEIGTGHDVADLGAGYGGWTVELARKVRDEGHIFSTEVDQRKLKDIRETVSDAGVGNVSVIWGSQTDTGLPPGCCDAILLRRVYHHFTEPESMRRSLARAIRPGGLIAVIEFEPGSQRSLDRPKGVPENRGGHGITKELLIDEMTRTGFEVDREIEPWHGRDYCVIFRASAITGSEN
jgi:ubiquinone/menaquinone biosynthesis C-methylase UbiE